MCESLASLGGPMGYVLYGKEVIAGGVTGALFAAWSASFDSIFCEFMRILTTGKRADRLGVRGGRRTMLLGLGSGGVVRVLREIQKAVE